MKLLATNSDVGSANAMIPALKRIAGEPESSVITVATAGSPAFQAFSMAGFNPIDTADTERLLEEKDPDVVLVGIGTGDQTVEKVVLLAAVLKRIPVVVVVESWPHLWLVNYGQRDIPLYLRAIKVLAFNQLSRQRFLDAGFSPSQIEVTGNPENDELPRMFSRRVEIAAELRRQFGIGPDDLVFTCAITNNLERGRLDIEENDPRWFGFRESEVVTEFLQAVAEAKLFRPVHAVIRIKPGRERAPLEELAAEHCPNSPIVGEECRDGRRVILASDMVVGTTTIMLQTASLLGVLPVCFYPRLTREDPQFANSLGIIKQVRGEGRLREFIIAATRPRIELERQALVSIDVPTGSTERVVKAIKSAVKA